MPAADTISRYANRQALNNRLVINPENPKNWRKAWLWGFVAADGDKGEFIFKSSVQVLFGTYFICVGWFLTAWVGVPLLLGFIAFLVYQITIFRNPDKFSVDARPKYLGYGYARAKEVNKAWASLNPDNRAAMLPVYNNMIKSVRRAAITSGLAENWSERADLIIELAKEQKDLELDLRRQALAADDTTDIDYGRAALEVARKIREEYGKTL